MTAPTVMRFSRTYPVPVDDAFDRLLRIPLEELFDRRYGPITPISGCTGQDGVWGTVGQSRTVRQRGGGSMHETLTRVDRPAEFSYELGRFTGPLKPLVARVEGTWAFAPAGTGTRITWSWVVHPTSAVAGRGLPLLARWWRGYARLGFERIEDHLVRD